MSAPLFRRRLRGGEKPDVQVPLIGRSRATITGFSSMKPFFTDLYGGPLRGDIQAGGVYLKLFFR